MKWHKKFSYSKLSGHGLKDVKTGLRLIIPHLGLLGLGTGKKAHTMPQPHSSIPSSQEACSLAHPVTQDHEQQGQRRGEELGAAAPTQAKGILSKAIKERVQLPVANSRKWRLVFSLGWGGWAVSELSLTSCNGGRQVGTS